MNAFTKEFLRTITRKPGRFLALLAIVALGAGFYAGLRMTAPDMRLAVDDYLDATCTYDVRVVSTMGLEEADLDVLRGLPTVKAVMGAYQADALSVAGEATYTTRIHSLPASAAQSESPDGIRVLSNDDSYLNRLILVEGAWPTRPGECLVSADRVLSRGIQLGDSFALTQGVGNLRDSFSQLQYTVVGKVHMPYYVSSAAIDASALGSGVVQQVLYVAPENFAGSYPITEAFVTVEGAQGERYGTQAYDECVEQAIAQIQSIAGERCQARLDSLTEELYSRATTYGGLLDLFEYRLSRTQAEIDDPELPEWLVMGRDKNAGMASFTSDGGRVDRIASIFPLIFFLVAALVALTTMTRMVDEDRQLIGTYKALGYSRGRIARKYVAYALAASVPGAVLGIAALSQVLPGVIMNAYAIMYFVPVRSLPIDWPLAFLSAGIAIGVVLFATWASVVATMRERPALLMLPPAPKSGKRIALEHVGPLWRRLSFSWKVTCRNIFRYKKRLFMTVIGIAGCTALLLTGLGLHDAINDIIDIQYGEIIRHNALITLEDDATEAQWQTIDDILQAPAPATQVQEGGPETTGRDNTSKGAGMEAGLQEGASAAPTASGVARAFTKTMLASGPRATDKRIDIVVPEDPQAFEQEKALRTRLEHEPLSIENGCLLLNEKLAQELGIGVGDTIRISPQDDMGNATSTVYEFTVGALFENYIYNYLYMTQADYERATGKAAPMNSVYATVVDDADARDALDQALRQTGAVKTITYNDETIGTYKTMLRSVDLIVVVLVVSAAALAFIVLYNLTNINIEERIREIATLKVLGFTRRETNAYIFREIALLAIIGAALGLALGVFLESFVVVTAEVDQVMFGRTIHLPSFVAGYVLTLAFSAASMLLMLPKLSRINMVESLKSLE